MQGETKMIYKNLVLSKFDNGFRIPNEKNLDDKFFVIDDVNVEIGDEFRVGPNGYFEKIGNINRQMADVDDSSYASILYTSKDSDFAVGWL